MEKGLVIRSTGSWYAVKLNSGETVDCRIRGRLRLKGFSSTNPVAVGDWVEVEKNDDGSHLICGIGQRRNYIIRRATKRSKRTHIIASNMDQVVLMASMKSPRTLTSYIDRFFVIAEAYSIPAVLVFNKTDIYREQETAAMMELLHLYRDIGYECFHISVAMGDNLHKAREVLKNKTSLISGQSGVGKSTLINALEPSLKLKTLSVSALHHTGRHGTTFAQMHFLNFGGQVIDTPGVKSLGVVDFGKEELFHYFREIFKISAACRFHNCTHTGEPDCAVQVAVAEGSISAVRYNNYIEMLQSDDIEQ